MVDSKGYQSRKISLVEEEIKSTMNSLQSSYIQLNKGINALSNIDTMPFSEFKYNKSEYQSKKEEIDKSFDNINYHIKTLQSTDIAKDDLKKKATSIINKIQSQLNNKIAEYNRIKHSIDKRSKEFINEGPNEYALFSDTKLSFKDYGEDKEHNDKRILELENIKRTSAEVASLSGEIKNHVDDQETKMNGVADNIERVRLNATMGEKDIRMIDQVKAGQIRKVIYLVMICLFLLMFVAYLLFKIFS